MGILPKVKDAKYKCKSCFHDFIVSDVVLGTTLTCPDCGGKMVPAQLFVPPKPEKKPEGEAKIRRKVDWQDAVVCYALGIFFLIPGVFVAHICSGQSGARYALRGMIVGIALWSGLWLALSTM